MTSTHEGQMNILPCGLPADATATHLFPALTTHSLISVGKFCDYGCEAIFNKEQVRIVKDERTILQGYHGDNGLWLLNLAEPNPQTLQHSETQHVAALVSTNIADQMEFLHAALFSPVVSTLTKAIKNGHLATWPGLTVENIRKYLPKSLATAKGHLDQTRKNTRSTKKQVVPNDDDSDDIFAAPQITDGKNTHFVYAAVIKIPHKTGQIYTDQTGALPIMSR